MRQQPSLNQPRPQCGRDLRAWRGGWWRAQARGRGDMP